ncbi:MAG: VOC family protein [Pyrinomonadaceae bacterium]
MTVKPIPEGYHTLSPHLICRGAAQAIEFYKAAFGAEELARFADPTGHIACAELRIGDSTFAIADENVEWKNLSPQHTSGTPVQIVLYVEDAHAVGQRAVAAGAEIIYPIEDHFYGERQGRLLDPFGHQWLITQHIEDVTPEVVAERMAEYCAEEGAN